MIYKNYEEFTDAVRSKMYDDDVCCSTLYIIMRCGYSVKELLEESFCIEAVSPHLSDGLMWFNDWYEGQQYIELYAAFTEEELLQILTHQRQTLKE